MSVAVKGQSMVVASHSLVSKLALHRALVLGVGVCSVALGCVGTMEERFPGNGGQADDNSKVVDCAPPTAPGGDGNHNPGDDCIGCHRPGGQATTSFTVAGTLYVDEQGRAPAAGQTIVIDDSMGKRISLITKDNGNFYSSVALAYPVRTSLASCPSVEPMLSKVDDGSCNSAACHNNGFRIYVP